MICPKCGKETQDNSSFCRVCGAKLSVDNPSAAEPVTQAPASATPKNRKPLILAISAVALILVLFIFIFIVRSNSPSSRFQEQLELGNRYLSEMNYEQAVAAFEAAIEIDPKNVEAYKGLIDAYAGQGNSDGILKAYEIASENLDEQSMNIVRDSASTGFMTVINVALEAGDKDSAREMSYSLAQIDMKSAERAILLVSDYSDQSEEESDSDETENLTAVAEPEPEPEPVITIYQPTDDEVKAAYAVALDIVTDLDYWGGNYFMYDINLWGQGDGWIPITNITTMSQLNEFLSNFFSENKIAEMDGYFKEKNGVLCGEVGFRGSDLGYESSWISDIVRESDTEIRVVITIQYRDIYSGDYAYFSDAPISYYNDEFTYIYENGKWVFDKIHPLY